MLAEWEMFAGQTPNRARDPGLARARFLSTPGLREWARKGQERSTTLSSHRRFELLGRMALEAELEHHPTIARARSALQRQLLHYRPPWKGRRVSPSYLGERLLHESLRSAREAAYYAAERFHAGLEARVRALIGMRNQRAKELGFRDYPEARLSLEGLSAARLRAMMEPFPGRLRPELLALRDRFQDQTRLRGWFPWDAAYYAGMEDPALPRKFPAREVIRAVLQGVRKWGFRDDVLRFRLTRHDTEIVGIEFPVDPPRDVRVIFYPRAGALHYGILFHEVGHAVHARSVRAPTHLLRCHEFAASFAGFNEGVGGIFEDIPSTEGWLKNRGFLPRQVEAIRERSRAGRALRVVELVGEIRDELRLYERPEAPLREERARYLRHFVGYDAYDPPSWVDSFLVAPPVHRQSYFLAFLFGAQVMRTALSTVGGELWPNARLGPWLTRTWFRPGARYDWLPRVREVTGRPLSGREALAALAGVPG